LRLDTRAAVHLDFSSAEFTIDWAEHMVTRLIGITNPPWTSTSSYGRPAFCVLSSRDGFRRCRNAYVNN
jgi:hypothetical protein